MLAGNGKCDPNLVATPLGIDARTNDETWFNFLLRLQKADVVDLCLIVEREAPAFPTVINGDLISVDGFYNPMKCLSRFFLAASPLAAKFRQMATMMNVRLNFMFGKWSCLSADNFNRQFRLFDHGELDVVHKETA